jgi:hypothetical protein
VADSWLLWLGSVVAVAFIALFALAGMPLAGVFLAAVVWLSPEGRHTCRAGEGRRCR